MFVARVLIDFVWFPGLSISQKQKSIKSLHGSALQNRSIQKILEISSKSESDEGVNLSAFNLSFKTPSGGQASVEVIFQGSKVFSGGGPFVDIYEKTSREAKKDYRLSESGQLIGFQYGATQWPLDPQTAFYDWLYLSAVNRNKDLTRALLEYEAYSDIEFNPAKSINCQAYSAALYKALVKRQLLSQALASPVDFLRIHKTQKVQSVPIQQGLL